MCAAATDVEQEVVLLTSGQQWARTCLNNWILLIGCERGTSKIVFVTRILPMFDLIFIFSRPAINVCRFFEVMAVCSLVLDAFNDDMLAYCSAASWQSFVMDV